MESALGGIEALSVPGAAPVRRRAPDLPPP
jgi:hypothetical protein